MNIIQHILHGPSRGQIRQIQVSRELGCSSLDIARIVGVTIDRLMEWKANNPNVADILKTSALPEYTIHHPEYATMVEEAFTCAGKRYYRFKEEYRMSTGRYKYYYAALREIELRASLDTLKKYVTAFKLVLNGGNKKQISIGDLWKLIINLETRLELAFDPQTVRHLASIAYFDETEDLTSYDRAYGDKKIELWVANDMTAFFLTKPIGELLGVSDISIDSLVEYLNQADQVIQDLNSSLQTVSEDNSSETGKET